MKAIMSIAVSFLFLLFLNTAIVAQDVTGNTNTTGKTYSTETDSTEQAQGTTGTQDKTTEQGTQSGTTSTGTTGAAVGTGKIHDLSGLDQDAAEELVREFDPVAEEHASQLASKLGLDQGDKEDIKSSIMDYFDDVWESRVELDQEKGDTEEERENNEDLADERVELVSEIEDELSDDQANTWKSFKVDWWKSLDTKIFEIQQNATSTMSRSNDDDNMKNKNYDNKE